MADHTPSSEPARSTSTKYARCAGGCGTGSVGSGRGRGLRWVVGTLVLGAIDATCVTPCVFTSRAQLKTAVDDWIDPDTFNNAGMRRAAYGTACTVTRRSAVPS